MLRRLLLPLTVLLFIRIGSAQTIAAGPQSRPVDTHAAPRTPIPVIFDTDIGYDIDDTWALAFLLASPELDLKLVVTDAQDTIGKAKIVAKFLEAAGRTDVPVGIGLKRSDTIGPQRKWITDYELSQYPGEVHEDGKLMHVAMEWNDLAAFERMVAERIAGYRPPAKHAAVSTRPSASLRGSRPNILIILSDDHGILDSGCYGSTVCRTPNLDRLASGGLRFTHAFVATAMCTPSRSTLYTGLYPHRHGAHANHSTSRDDVLSLPHYLRPLGYRVGLAGKRHIQPASTYPFEYMNVAAMEGFITRNREQPFCLVLASNDPHTPYKVPPPGKGHDRARIEVPPYLVDTPRTRELLDHYYTSVEALDAQVGDVSAMLERLDLTESTLVWYASDHGAGVPFSKWTLYDAGLRVPCIVSWPGHVRSGVTDAMIGLVDVLPTCIDLAGGTPPETLDGRSLIDVLARTRQSHRDVVFATHTNEGIINGSRYPIRAVRTRTHKYIRNFNPDGTFENLITRGPRERPGQAADAEPATPEPGPATEPSVIWPEWKDAARANPTAAQRVHLYQHRPAEELYDLRSDPYELHNLAADPAMKDLLTDLRTRLADWMRQQGDPLAN